VQLICIHPPRTMRICQKLATVLYAVYRVLGCVGIFLLKSFFAVLLHYYCKLFPSKREYYSIIWVFQMFGDCEWHDLLYNINVLISLIQSELHIFYNIISPPSANPIKRVNNISLLPIVINLTYCLLFFKSHNSRCFNNISAFDFLTFEIRLLLCRTIFVRAFI